MRTLTVITFRLQTCMTRKPIIVDMTRRTTTRLVTWVTTAPTWGVTVGAVETGVKEDGPPHQPTKTMPDTPIWLPSTHD
ncbi:unnamed protein product [Timema podura]|uniref:Secreted protein n=1 Tax=Timema podura TaxID=61482 RepID=A0ABN7NI36_TIMPD|nr:unnamed protein product [Timema podura]